MRQPLAQNLVKEFFVSSGIGLASFGFCTSALLIEISATEHCMINRHETIRDSWVEGRSRNVHLNPARGNEVFIVLYSVILTSFTILDLCVRFYHAQTHVENIADKIHT